MPRVFISHSSQDREAVERNIISQLEAHGVETWYSQDNIRTASEWERQIRQGLKECDWFLVALSPRSVASEWVSRETHWAFLKRQGRIIPVMLETCDPEDLHLGLLPLQFVDFRDDAAQARERLLAVWGLDTAGKVEGRYRAARDAIAGEDWAAAAESLQDVLRLDPTHKQAEADLEHARRQLELTSLYEAGAAHLREARWGEALDAFERLREAGGGYKDVDELMAAAAAGLDNVEAERLCREARESAAWEDWAKAAEQYSEALKRNPAHAEAQAGLDHALRRGELAESYEAGLEHLRAQRWREALKSFRRVRSVDRNYKGVSDLIADADAGLDEEETQRAVTGKQERKAGEEAERPAQPARSRAGAKARPSAGERAPRYAAKAETPQFTEATKGTDKRPLGKVLVTVAVIIVLSTVVTQWCPFPPEATDLTKQADTSSPQGKHAEAEDSYREAIKLNPNDAGHRYNLGVALIEQKKYAEAEAEFRKAVELNPNSALYRHHLGIALGSQKRSAEAEAEYRKALALNPSDAVCHHNLGRALADQKKYAEAEAEFRKAIELNPTYDWNHNQLGFALIEQKKYAEAEAEFRKAVALNPDDAVHHNGLGITLYYQEKYAEAEAAYRKAVELGPNSALYHANLALSLLRQNRRNEAAEENRKALQIDPNNEVAKRNQTQL